MPATPDFLDSKRDEIKARLNELRPLVTEYQRLEAAARALDGVPATNGTAPTVLAGSSQGGKLTPVPAAAVKSAKPRARTRTGKPRGRPKGGGTRRAQALQLVTETPGITIPEMAERMGIKQNYLYRVLPGLAEDGLVRKDERGWHPVEQAPST